MPDRFWVGGSGTWDSTSTAHWAAVSGGSPGSSAPTAADNVFFDQLGTYTVTITNPYCLDFTVSAGTVTFAGVNPALRVSGNINLIAGTVFSAGSGALGHAVYLLGTGKTVTLSGTTFPNMGFRFSGSTTLLDALTCTYMLMAGTLNFNGYTVTLTTPGTSFAAFSINGAGVVLNFGTDATILLTGASAQWQLTSITYAPTLSGTATIQFYGASSSFVGVNLSVVWSGVKLVKGGTGTLAITGTNTFDAIQTIANPVTISFPASLTTTITNFYVSGTSGNLVSLISSSSGTKFNISKASGTVNSIYLSVKDSNATGGATWNAYNSTNVSNNAGWNFPTLPATGGGTFLTLLE